MHVWVAPPGSVSQFLKSLVVAEIFYCITSVAIKLSILLSYRRIFPVDYMKKATTAVALMVFAWAVACVSSFGILPCFIVGHLLLTNTYEIFIDIHCLSPMYPSARLLG